MGMEVASDLDEAAAYQWAAAETEVTRHGRRSGGDGKVVEPIVVVPPKSEGEKFSLWDSAPSRRIGQLWADTNGSV